MLGDGGLGLLPDGHPDELPLGLNAFFAYIVVVGMGLSWQGALAAVFISGACFFVLTLLRARP